jgi:HEAT repeat protein
MDIKDQRRQFLEDLTTQYKFYGDTRTAFLGRFAHEKADILNNQLRLDWAKDHVDKGQKLQDELKKIYPALRGNGCEIPETKQGRYKKGESPWELAYSWLWRDKFPEWQTLQAEKEKYTETPLLKKESLDWRGICGQMLAEQKQLTTNAFTNADGVSLQREEIYVPLAIVERKPPKPQPRNPQEEKEEEKLIPIAEESFFEEVLRSGQSSSQGRRIAVIGEPGSGKTTRLQKIADWILEQGLGLPIWVSLADLTQPTIAQYIEEFWLKQTGQSLTIEALTQQKDQIWLLLDGVDEMTSSVEARHVSALLGGWLQVVRVVVSCRVNVWEADKNAFSGFDVFRNLEFSPEQVRDYIRCWFAGAGDVATGEDLDRALSQSENYRLKELIQNPLRLWMLCHIWYRNRGDLPETQAELYGQFVDRVYDWKADEEILDQREAIDAALAKLALAAMEQQDEVSRFRLRESWVVKKLGSRQIFEAVKKLGWLNRVERSPEAICVFYHATFQEYFAALGVEDWGDFLPKDHKNSLVEGKKYRIFEPQWKQVILLWLGREDITDAEKEEFIEKLVSFDDGCGEWDFEKVDKGFYEYRAYFLAAAGINEFKSCSLAAEIVRYVVKWGFGYFNIEKQEWQTFLNLIEEEARKTIPETIRQLAITELTNILEHCLDEYICIQVAKNLGEIGQGNPQAIAALIRILETTEDKYICSQAANILGEIGQGNPQAIAELIRILETTEDEYICSQAANILGEIDRGSPQAIAELIRIMETAEDGFTISQAAKMLGEIGQGNLQAFRGLSRILEIRTLEIIKVENIIEVEDTIEVEDEDTEDLISFVNKITQDEIVRSAAKSLGKLEQENTHMIAVLIRILETTEHEYIRIRALESLGEIGEGNPHVIAALIRILETTEDEYIRWSAANSLGKIDQGNPHVIAALIRILETTEDKYSCMQALKSLGEIGEGNPHVIAALIRILETTEDENVRVRVWALESLGEIGEGNPHVIATLIRILETTEDEDIRCRVAGVLGEIDQGNPYAITALIKILETTKCEDTRCWVAGVLGEIDQGNPYAITALIKILPETTEYEHIGSEAAGSLQRTLATPEQYKNTVSALKDYLSHEVYQNNFDRFNNCYKVLWECAANLPYPDFHHAWHSTPE